MPFPVKWKNQTYYLTALTIDVKTAFCQWLTLRLRSDAMRDFQGYPAQLNAYLDGLRARVWWVETKMSPSVWEWLYKSQEGGVQYARLLLRAKNPKGELIDLSDEIMSDDDLTKMIDAKEADEASDYMVALKQIHEDANPKANGPVSGSPQTETTPTVP